MPERADAARNRAAVLAAAHRLICARGPHSVSMDDIAAEAGVGKGTLFRRFGDRAGLIRALVDQQTQDWQTEALARAADPAVPAARRAVRFLTDVLDLTIRHLPVMGTLEWVSPDNRFCGGNYQAWQRRMAELVAEARPELDAELLAAHLFAALRPDVIEHLLDGRGMTADRVRAGVLALATSALGPVNPPGDLVPPPPGCDDASDQERG